MRKSFRFRPLILLSSLGVVIPPASVLSFRAQWQQETVRNRWNSPIKPVGTVFGTTEAHTTICRPPSALRAEGIDHPYEYDLAVIGAGPVGVQAAIVAASTAKKKVVLIDAPRASGQLMNEETNEDLSIGGPTGLFSKALRDAAKRIKVPTLRGMNLREDSIWNEITSSCVELASFNANDVKRQLEYAGVTLIEGYAKFSDVGGSHHLTVCQTGDTVTSTISTDKVLIATGSRPFRPDNIPFDGVRVFDSDSINGLKFLPKSLVITGR